MLPQPLTFSESSNPVDILQQFSQSVNTLALSLPGMFTAEVVRQYLESIIRDGNLLLTKFAANRQVVKMSADIRDGLNTAKWKLFLLNATEGKHVQNLLPAREIIKSNLHHDLEERAITQYFEQLSVTNPSLALPYVLLLIRINSEKYIPWLYQQLVEERISTKQMRFMTDILMGQATTAEQLASKAFANKMIYLMTDPAQKEDFEKAEKAARESAAEAKQEDMLGLLIDLARSSRSVSRYLGLELKANAYLLYLKSFLVAKDESAMVLTIDSAEKAAIQSARTPAALITYLDANKSLAACYLEIIALKDMSAKDLKLRPTIAEHTADIIDMITVVRTQVDHLTKQRLVKFAVSLSRLPISSENYKLAFVRFLQSFMHRLGDFSISELLQVLSSMIHAKVSFSMNEKFYMVTCILLDIKVSSVKYQPSLQECIDALYMYCFLLVRASRNNESGAFIRAFHTINAAISHINAHAADLAGENLRKILFAYAFLSKITPSNPDSTKKGLVLDPDLIARASHYAATHPLYTKSSKLHLKQADFLKRLYLKVENEVLLDLLLNVDIYLPEFDTIISIQGSQHYKFSEQGAIDELISTDDWHEFILGCVSLLQVNWKDSHNQVELVTFYQASRTNIYVHYQELDTLKDVTDEARYDFWQAKLPIILPVRGANSFVEIQEICQQRFALESASSAAAPKGALAASMGSLLEAPRASSDKKKESPERVVAEFLAVPLPRPT